MKKIDRLSENLRVIFKYEFETGCYGMVMSDYTDDIISHEVERLARHRKPLDESKIYTLHRATVNTVIKEFESIDDVIDAISNGFGDYYIMDGQRVSVIDFDNEGNHMIRQIS